MAHGSWLMAHARLSQFPPTAPASTARNLPPLERVSPKTGMISSGPTFASIGGMESRVICERTFTFGCRIVKLCEVLWKRGDAARKIADQLFDAGTSIGANTAESQGGQTKPDFIAKLSIARKESWEAIFWLRLALASSKATQDEIAWELDEAKQLKAMITQAIKTAQSSSWRGDPQ